MGTKNGGIIIKVVKEIVTNNDNVDRRLILTDCNNLGLTLAVLSERLAKTNIPDHECIIRCI